jgi:hypothetical protein
MPAHLFREIENLKREIWTLGAMAESAVREAVAAIDNRDEDAAQAVIANGTKLDEMEVRIEEDCLKTLALHQPVAIDLRFIVAVPKINNDLERVGDLAVNVAERAAFLATQPPLHASFDLHAMAGKAQFGLLVQGYCGTKGQGSGIGDNGTEWRDNMRAQFGNCIFMGIGEKLIKDAVSDNEPAGSPG